MVQQPPFFFDLRQQSCYFMAIFWSKGLCSLKSFDSFDKWEMSLFGTCEVFCLSHCESSMKPRWTWCVSGPHHRHRPAGQRNGGSVHPDSRSWWWRTQKGLYSGTKTLFKFCCFNPEVSHVGYQAYYALHRLLDYDWIAANLKKTSFSVKAIVTLVHC